jgi:flagellar biosynthesis activator protein FlaF
MHKATQAYGAVAKQTATPRELEASLLVKAATLLQSAKDDTTRPGSALNQALTYNQRLWTFFASAVADPESPLPKDVRNNIASLSVFIFKQTLDAQMKPAPDKIAPLISINRELAAGLRGIAAA